MQVNVVAVAVLSDRLVHEVDVHPPGEGIGDDERRRREVIRLHLGVDARLEVPVSGEHRAHDQVALRDRVGDRLGQGAGVSDARRAAVPDRLESELVEIPRQARLLVVFGHDLGAWRERGFNPGLALQPPFDGALCQEAGAHHHLRVGGVRAGRDRRDHD